MSFGEILKLKKEQTEDNKTLYKKHIVVGDDFFTLALYKTLVDKHGKDNVSLLIEHEFSERDLLPMGPSMIRGQKNIDAFKAAFPEIQLKETQLTSTFFKEQKFREFGGRAKPEKLLWSEEFFVEPRVELNLREAFPALFEGEFLTQVNECRLDMVLTGVTTQEATDLVEPAYFSLHCANGMNLECEHLYWGRGPRKFLDLYSDKNSLSDDFIQFCEETHTPAALYVDLEFQKPLTERLETIFIPHSYTHEWGHFVGEFSEIEKGAGSQNASFVTYIDKDHTSEEDLSKKIRLLKRHLEKIFPEFSKISYSEYIKLSESSPCLKIDDPLFLKVRNEIKNLKMVSVNAPLGEVCDKNESCEDSVVAPSFFVRGALSLKEIELSL